MKHHAREDGLGKVGGFFNMGKVKSQGGNNVLQGGGTGGTTFWIGYFVTFSGDGKEVGGHTCGFSEVDHGKVRAMKSRQEMGYNQGRSSGGSSGTSVRNYLHMETTGNCGTVGGAAEGFLRCAQERKATMGEDTGGTNDVVKRWRRNSFGKILRNFSQGANRRQRGNRTTQ